VSFQQIRTGIGVDVHQFEQGRAFWLGGVHIPYQYGLKGHSDADVLIHAVMDALLGAAGLNDIGYYFPDSDMKWKNISSSIMLQEVLQLISTAGYTIGNIDCVICLEQPKIAPYIQQMKDVISSTLSVQTADISIKATTFETMGFVGKKEGVLSFVTCLLYKR